MERLKSIEAPVQPVITLRKMRTFLPYLKSKIEKNLHIQEVYKIVRPGCNACFFVQTNRHHLTRFKPVANQFLLILLDTLVVLQH